MNKSWLVFCCLLITVPVQGADWWPDFRGPHGNGIADVKSAPARWSETENVDWKTNLPGRGWSSPVVADGHVWLSTAVEEIPTGDDRIAALESLGEDPKKFKQRHIATKITLRLLKVDLKSGELRWQRDLVQLENPEAIHTVNSYSSPTPVIDEKHIYCHFGTYGTICLNRESLSETWRRQLPLEHSVGPGSSPFLYQDKLILICDGVDRQYVTALDKETGETIWEMDRPEMDAPTGDQKKSFDTPIAFTDSAGREQIVCMGSQWLVSYEPDTGKEIWKVYHGKGFSVVPRPVYHDGVVYISTGFGKPQLWAIGVDGDGDVTDTHVQWTAPKGIPAKPSPLLVGEELYVVSDDGIATCFSIHDGSTHWKQRLGGKYSSSPIYADEKIYFCSEEGKMLVVKPGTDYEVISENELDGHFMASFAAINNFLLVRSQESLYRISDN